ncbi:hypothetical protein AB0F52_09655 [Amycolatopsis sp. NPDC024027]|uniref:hypothetical protein n=1 Tax=Amycolatopsis sp. NPDC024027 TaxID=3154327 RepID=UPI003401B9D8
MGSRGPELTATGALIVTVGRSQQRSVQLELDGDPLELTGVSSKERCRLNDEWLLRYGSWQ